MLPGICADDEEPHIVSEDDEYEYVEVLYQSFCLKDYPPPATIEEEEKCFHSRRECWREREAREAAERLRQASRLPDATAGIGCD